MTYSPDSTTYCERPKERKNKITTSLKLEQEEEKHWTDPWQENKRLLQTRRQRKTRNNNNKRKKTTTDPAQEEEDLEYLLRILQLRIDLL